MLAAMARTVVPQPRWVRSIYMMAPRLSLLRRIFREATKVPVGAMVAPEAYTLWNMIGRWAAAQAVPVAASAVLPATSAPVAQAAEEEAAVPLVLFKAKVILIPSTK